MFHYPLPTYAFEVVTNCYDQDVMIQTRADPGDSDSKQYVEGVCQSLLCRGSTELHLAASWAPRYAYITVKMS